MKKVKLLAMDVDGTMTDGKIYMGISGESFKVFDIKDGYAIHELLPKYGIKTAIITGRSSKIVENRAKELDVDFVFQGVENKLMVLKKLADKINISLSEVAYIGDDISDLECINESGYSACPADAVVAVSHSVKFICKNKCGDGAVREFAEYLVNSMD